MKKFDEMVSHPAMQLFPKAIKPCKSGKAWQKWVSQIYKTEYASVLQYYQEKDTLYEWKFAMLTKLPEVKKLQKRVVALQKALIQHRPKADAKTEAKADAKAEAKAKLAKADVNVDVTDAADAQLGGEE